MEYLSENMDIESLVKIAGYEAWDIWRDERDELRISVDGVSLVDELEKFAELVVDGERERCHSLLNLTRSEAQLMAGEMTVQEWRTVSAILKGIQAKIERG